VVLIRRISFKLKRNLIDRKWTTSGPESVLRSQLGFTLTIRG
jgi:hypothetical protein